MLFSAPFAHLHLCPPCCQLVLLLCTFAVVPPTTLNPQRSTQLCIATARRGKLGLFPRWSSNGLSETSAGLQALLPAASKTLALTAGITMPGGQIVKHASTDLVERQGVGELALRSMDESFAVSVPVKGGPALGGQRAIMTSSGLVYRDKSLEVGIE